MNVWILFRWLKTFTKKESVFDILESFKRLLWRRKTQIWDMLLIQLILKWFPEQSNGFLGHISKPLIKVNINTVDWVYYFYWGFQFQKVASSFLNVFSRGETSSFKRIGRRLLVKNVRYFPIGKRKHIVQSGGACPSSIPGFAIFFSIFIS